MQILCCWPPESPRALFFQAVLYLIPDGSSPEGIFHQLVQFYLGTDAVGSGTVGDVVIDAHGKWIRLLENHAHPFPEKVHIHILVNILAVQKDLSLDAAALHQIVHPVQRFQKRRFPQPEGPMKAVISFPECSG